MKYHLNIHERRTGSKPLTYELGNVIYWNQRQIITFTFDLGTFVHLRIL